VIRQYLQVFHIEPLSYIRLWVVVAVAMVSRTPSYGVGLARWPTDQNPVVAIAYGLVDAFAGLFHALCIRPKLGTPAPFPRRVGFGSVAFV
jgi:hypothetical protein